MKKFFGITLAVVLFLTPVGCATLNEIENPNSGQEMGDLGDGFSGATIAVNRQRCDLRFCDQRFIAQHGLLKDDARPLEAAIAGTHRQKIIHAGGLLEVDIRLQNGEGRRIIAAQEVLMADAAIPQKIRAATLKILQIIGVIDEAGKIGVLVIHPHKNPVLVVIIKV